MGGFWHGVAIFFGLTNASGRSYLAWSGAGADLGEATIIGGLATVVRHQNCHSKGCWRLGHALDGTPYRVCHRHHPEHGHRSRNVPLAVIHGVHRRAHSDPPQD